MEIKRAICHLISCHLMFWEAEFLSAHSTAAVCFLYFYVLAVEMFCERALLQYKEVGLKTYNEALEECRSVTGSTVASKLSLTRGCMGKMIERIRDEQKLNDLPTAWVNCGKFEYGPTTCETSLASDGFSYRPSHSHSVICETKGKAALIFPPTSILHVVFASTCSPETGFCLFVSFI